MLDDTTPFPPPGFVPAPSKVEGIEVYVPGGSTEVRPDLVDFKCPRCGATIAYSVDKGQLSCDHCGYQEAPDALRLGKSAEQFEFTVETVRRAQQGWGEDRKELACQRCGGVVSVPPDTLSYSCPFCGSNKVIFRETLEDVLRPRYLIPFKTSPAECQALTRKWIGGSWMIPSDLRRLAQPGQAADPGGAVLGRFHPIYIPYWTFDATAKAAWRAQVGHTVTEHYTDHNGRRQTRQRIEWREESGKVQKVFNDVLVPGTTRLNLGILAKIDAFNLNDLILYEPRYLAGMQAQAYDLPLDEAWEAGRQILRELTRQACLDRASTDRVRNFTMNLDFSDEQWRYILVPIYTSVYRYGDKTYQVLVNGQTGKIAGPRPVDWVKVWLVIAAILAPGLLVLLAGLLVRSSDTSMLGMFLTFAGLVIGFFLARQAQEIENV